MRRAKLITHQALEQSISPDDLVELVVDALDDLKGVNTVCLDVSAQSEVMDYLVISSGNSNRHVKSLADSVTQKAKAAGTRPLGIEGADTGEWVLVDLGDVVVHVMQPATRDFYDLERLWTPIPESNPG
ncbi:MAG: ribosome silencing factor [Pseudomonadota bacterium]